MRMKKILFLAVFMLMVCETTISANSFLPYQEIVLVQSMTDKDEDERPIKGMKEITDGPKTRSLIGQTVHACLLDNNTLSIVFQNAVENATISIISTDNEATVYWESYNYPTEITIDMSSEQRGDYTIEISTDCTTLTGDFILQ